MRNQAKNEILKNAGLFLGPIGIIAATYLVVPGVRNKFSEIPGEKLQKREVHNQKISKIIQLEQNKTNIQNLEKEYSDILYLAKKLGVTIVFAGNTIEFHTDSQINFDYLVTRMEQLGNPYMSEHPNQYGSHIPTNFENNYKVTVKLGESGQLLRYRDRYEKTDI